jgi:alpha-L-glutamate ligase-like protein
MGLNRRNLELIYRHNPRAGFPVVDDKILTKEALSRAGVPVPRTLRIVDTFLAARQAAEALEREASFVVKPARGSGGGGVLIAESLPEGGWRTPSGRRLDREQMLQHLADILFGVYSLGRADDRALVERRVVPHPFFREIYARGIADIRIILLKEQPVMSMMRIPTDASDGKANLHQGAMGVRVGLEDGRTGQGEYRRQPATRHPDTGAPVSGRKLPFWSQLLDHARAAARAMPLKYIGVDLVIDAEAGPLMLEVNARPGLQIQVINGAGLVPAVESVG